MGNKKTGHLNPIGRFWARFSLQKNTIKDIMEAIDGTGRWIIDYKRYNINVKFPIFKKCTVYT